MFVDFLRSFHGVVAMVQVLLGAIALFVAAFIWDGWNVYIQFIYGGYGWQTLINLILLVTWLLAIFTLFAGLSGRDFRADLGKRNLLIIYAVAIGMLLLIGVLEAWYASIGVVVVGSVTLKGRFIVCCICIWLLFVSYVALLIVTIVFN